MACYATNRASTTPPIHHTFAHGAERPGCEGAACTAAAWGSAGGMATIDSAASNTHQPSDNGATSEQHQEEPRQSAPPPKAHTHTHALSAQPPAVVCKEGPGAHPPTPPAACGNSDTTNTQPHITTTTTRWLGWLAGQVAACTTITCGCE